jgi:hypothetical protein
MSILRIGRTIDIDIIWHKEITIHVLFLGITLCFSRILELLNLVWFLMAWIVLLKDKDSTYATTLKVYKKIQNVTNAQRKLSKESRIVQTKVDPNVSNT